MTDHPKCEEHGFLCGMKVLQNPYLPPDTIVVSTAIFQRWVKMFGEPTPADGRLSEPKQEGEK